PIPVAKPRRDRRKLVHHRIDDPHLLPRQLQHQPHATRPPPRTPIRPTPIRKRRERRIEHESRTVPCEGPGRRGGAAPSDYRGANAAPPLGPGPPAPARPHLAHSIRPSRRLATG